MTSVNIEMQDMLDVSAPFWNKFLLCGNCVVDMLGVDNTVMSR